MRLIEIIAENSAVEALEKKLAGIGIEQSWILEHSKGEKHIRQCLIENEKSAELLDAMGSLVDQGTCQVIVIPVEASLPRLEKVPEKKEEEKKIKIGNLLSISKEELYDDVVTPVNITFGFVAMVVLSAIVAGIGLLQDNTTVIIGAMVIAPFLGPNVALSMGTTLGDVDLIRKALYSGGIATGLTLAISLIWGLLDPRIHAMAGTLSVNYGDVILAAACGFAGVVSMMSAQASALVGVMVAAALLPPLMRAGLLIGGGEWLAGTKALVIYLTNITCLNISGVITFYATGITPNKWWEKARSKKQIRISLIVWISMLVFILTAIALLRL